jgi:O-antigen ligase
MVAGTVVTFSRGGLLALAAAAAVLAWKIGRKHRLAVASLILVSIVVFFAFAPSGYSNRLLSIYAHDLDAFGSAASRWAVLLISIKVALRNPLFGVGMGNFHYVSIAERESHNAYTQVAAEMGLAALLIYTLFIVTPLRGLRRIERDSFAARRASRFYYLAVGLQASLIGYMVASFFASVAYYWNVYYLVGYAVCLRRLYEAAAESAAPEDEGQVAGSANRALVRVEEQRAPRYGEGREGFPAERPSARRDGL